ncbi:MAG: hypothetical protein J6Z46_00310 [Lachnospiraceae bacterium]|nr:hypothetical protein [Lachnospiraceae bacterium]
MFKNKKFFTILLIFAVFTAVFAGCGDSSDEGPENLLNIDGTWTDDEGFAISFYPDESICVIRTPYGRIGHCSYTPEEGYFYFDGFIYDLQAVDPDTVSLRKNGHSRDETEESLDGYVFKRTDLPGIRAYDRAVFDGNWVNEIGTHLTLNMDTMEYDVHSESGAANGTIGDEDNGKGLFIFRDGKSYLILNDDGSLTVITEDPDFANTTFVRE